MPAHWFTLHESTDASAWRPLERLAAQAAARPGLPPVDPDDFLYCARITRANLPVLHVYRHVLTHRYLNVDEGGLVWRYIGPGPKGEDPRYAFIEDLAEALAMTELTRAELLAGRTRRGRRAPAPPAPFGVTGPVAGTGPVRVTGSVPSSAPSDAIADGGTTEPPDEDEDEVEADGGRDGSGDDSGGDHSGGGDRSDGDAEAAFAAV